MSTKTRKKKRSSVKDKRKTDKIGRGVGGRERILKKTKKNDL